MVSVKIVKKDLEKMLSEYRYQHCLNVAKVAKKLAKVYEYDKEKAYLAGILHDIAKEFTEEENLEVLKRNGMDVEAFENFSSRLLHSTVGAMVARERYDIDEEIYHAIACHTLGDVPMNLLDKIVFVADKIEPGKDYAGIEEERELAFQNIDQALILCLENNHKKLKSQGKKIYKKSIQVLKYLKENT